MDFKNLSINEFFISNNNFYAMLVVCVLRLFLIINFTKFDLEKYDFNLYNGIFMWNKCFAFGKLQRKRFQVTIFL